MQIEELEKEDKNLPTINVTLSTNLSYETHSEAIYTSRLLDFNNLPEPKNSDDYYYERPNSNSINMEHSGK